jgi:DivIVA domain-containing protein
VHPSFSQVRLREGYAIVEVDDFLNRVERGMVTADEVRNVQFTTVRLRSGYNEDQVDDHLDEIEAMLRRRERDDAVAATRHAAAPPPPPPPAQVRIPAAVHHVELWVPDLARATRSWGWLLAALRWQPHQQWAYGRSWRFADTYLVIEQSPDLRPGPHDRMRPGLNHLALHAGERQELDAIVAHAAGYGWRLLFADRHPFAGGPNHYAAYLENEDGFEVELVARP